MTGFGARSKSFGGHLIPKTDDIDAQFGTDASAKSVRGAHRPLFAKAPLSFVLKSTKNCRTLRTGERLCFVGSMQSPGDSSGVI